MPIINGLDRHQLTFSSLEAAIATDNDVRFIDAFVDKLNLQQLGVRSLTSSDKKKEGRSSFSDSLFLKLYLYAYLNGIRSSRKLEREAIRNIELQWLLQRLHPNYHSIADFRKINAKALQNLFKLFVSFLKDAGLVGGKEIAVDGTKIRGNNRISTVENGVFSIAEIIEYRTETRNNYYRYSFLFRNKLFQSRCYCRGKSLVINQKYFLALDPEKPGYNNFLLYNYPVPDSITSAPPEGWEELPIPVDKEEIRKFLEDY